MTAFEEFGVMPEIGKAVEEMDWNLPTDVQAEAIPLILGGGDVLMAAETGSGKTGAFCLPILQITWETLKDFQEGKLGGKKNGEDKPVSQHWAMSFYDRGPAMAVTPDGLRCQSREQREWHGCRATKGVQGKGKYYYEALVSDEGLCRVGFSTPQALLDLGTCRFGYGFGGTGKKSNNKQFDSYGGPFGQADVIGCYLDLDNMEISYTKNGQHLGKAFTINAQQKGSVFFPAVVLKNAEMLFNFGDTPWKFPPQSKDFIGFAAVDPKSTVPNDKTGGGAVEEKKIVNNAPQAIIIEPSRELAEQTLKQLQQFKTHLNPPAVKELLLVGGANINDQMDILRSGVDIVVATPGRLEDLINTGKLSLRQCRFFVLDEADGLLKQGHDGLINRIHSKIPKITSDGKRLQMIVCSATLHSFEVKKMAEKLMNFPTWVDLKGQDSVPETVHHVVVMVDPRNDTSWKNYKKPLQTDGVHHGDNTGRNATNPEALSEAVKMMKGEYCLRAINQNKMDYGIIFCRTKNDCDNLEKYLNAMGGGRQNNKQYSCVCLHGDRKPAERKANLDAFKNKDVRFLICTDVAARGIDVKGIPFIINVTLPDEKSNYVHRIGRVGRAERMGLAISIVSTVPEKVWYHGQWCQSRGKNCYNTNLTDVKGCCMWYNEPQYLADIEEHLGVTIQQIDTDMRVEANEFDGKVIYGQKKKSAGSGYAGHSSQLASAVAQLSELETQTQDLFLRNFYMREKA